MLTIYSSDHRFHYGVELEDGAVSESFEKPARAETVLAQVMAAKLGDVVGPHSYDQSIYAGAHSQRYVEFLAGAWNEWSATGRSCQALPLVWPVRGLASTELPQFIDGKLGFFSMDAGSPINAGTWDAACASANCALTGADRLSGSMRAAFALCRPPGHHAGREYMGGYCYLNNAAIAAQRCIDQGARRVAVLDVDFHHGNGTQDIFYDRNEAAGRRGNVNRARARYRSDAREASDRRTHPLACARIGRNDSNESIGEQAFSLLVVARRDGYDAALGLTADRAHHPDVETCLG